MGKEFINKISNILENIMFTFVVASFSKMPYEFLCFAMHSLRTQKNPRMFLHCLEHGGMLRGFGIGYDFSNMQHSFKGDTLAFELHLIIPFSLLLKVCWTTSYVQQCMLATCF